MALKKTWKNIFALLKTTYSEFSADHCFKLSASLAYYTVFSLAPLLIIIITLTGFFLGEEAAQGEIYLQIRNLVGSETAAQVEEMIQRVSVSGHNLLAAITSGVV